MRTKALVTVIIPVFNVSFYLEEALDSILHQSYQNFEVIIIDDGSTDGSEEICDRCSNDDKRVKVIHQNNQGLSAARNAGLDMMKGDYVVFLDADDAYDPDYLQIMIEAVCHEDIDIAICKYSVHNSLGKMYENSSMKMYPSIEEGIYDRKEALQNLAEGTINHSVWNKIYSRKLWEKERFAVGHVFEDIAITFKLFNLCKNIYVLNEPLYMHRNRPGSIANTISFDNIYDMIWAYTRFESFVNEHIPHVFSYNQLEKCRKKRFTLMISYYLRSFCDKTCSAQTYGKRLRNEIIKEGQKNGVNCLEFRMRLCYWMIRFCPWFLSVFYPAYRFIK